MQAYYHCTLTKRKSAERHITISYSIRWYQRGTNAFPLRATDSRPPDTITGNWIQLQVFQSRNRLHMISLLRSLRGEGTNLLNSTSCSCVPSLSALVSLPVVLHMDRLERMTKQLPRQPKRYHWRHRITANLKLTSDDSWVIRHGAA